MSFAKKSSGTGADVLETNDYYAFGMNHLGTENFTGFGQGAYENYKYNGKELQETGFLDYGWRQYMPDLGRWFGMDQLSESYLSYSPYAYVLNNPVMHSDPDGRYTLPKVADTEEGGGGDPEPGGGFYFSSWHLGNDGGTDAWNGLSNLGNGDNDSSNNDYSAWWNSTLSLYGINMYSFSNITPQLAGIYAHRTLAKYINDNNEQGYWHTEKGINFWNQDLIMRPDIYYMNNGMNAVWELKPDTQMMNSFSFKGQSQAEGYAYALSIQKKQQFYTGSSHGAPPPIVSGTPLTDQLGYSFTYTIPKGTDGMIYYTCTNCKEPGKERQPAVNARDIRNAAIISTAAYVIYKIAVGIATWECGGCGVLVTP